MLMLTSPWFEYLLLAGRGGVTNDIRHQTILPNIITGTSRDLEQEEAGY